ncbi:hypothetical protein [Sinomicrobium weinanense]|uniref:Uncharacterized protein n=1 Tax=Sinomicrobium weinanense TaxID=2842200 RepID=A0A926Q341_9FLAO|nr:hypothetical protein [Sinomicrobium weinanense]MBC9795355.1 hypothetical protein [Sinomicrobium weinanense]MBU3122930.1 hypothetical protein [Sinomicrobium weinanense]
MKQKQTKSSRDKLVLWVIDRILNIQSRWAAWIDRKTSHISPKAWVLLLACFVLVSVAYNTWLIWHSLTFKEKQIIQIPPASKESRDHDDSLKAFDSILKNKPKDSSHIPH